MPASNAVVMAASAALPSQVWVDAGTTATEATSVFAKCWNWAVVKWKLVVQGRLHTVIPSTPLAKLILAAQLVGLGMLIAALVLTFREARIQNARVLELQTALSASESKIGTRIGEMNEMQARHKAETEELERKLQGSTMLYQNVNAELEKERDALKQERVALERLRGELQEKDRTIGVLETEQVASEAKAAEELAKSEAKAAEDLAKLNAIEEERDGLEKAASEAELRAMEAEKAKAELALQLESAALEMAEVTARAQEAEREKERLEKELLDNKEQIEQMKDDLYEVDREFEMSTEQLKGEYEAMFNNRLSAMEKRIKEKAEATTSAEKARAVEEARKDAKAELEQKTLELTAAYNKEKRAITEKLTEAQEAQVYTESRLKAKSAMLKSEQEARKRDAVQLKQTSDTLTRIRTVELPAWRERAEVAAERLEEQAEMAAQQAKLNALTEAYKTASGAELDSMAAAVPPSSSLADAIKIAEVSLLGQRALAADSLPPPPSSTESLPPIPTDSDASSGSGVELQAAKERQRPSFRKKLKAIGKRSKTKTSAKTEGESNGSE